MVIRIDDVSPNTDFLDLKNQIKTWLEFYPDTKFILGVTILAKFNEDRSVYPDAPFKDKPMEFFYGVDLSLDLGVLNRLKIHDDELASHGLVHVDHSMMSKDAQEFSIITSCNLLGAKKFIPPFNQYNTNTEAICTAYGIELIKNKNGVKWRSLETEEFDPAHGYWYYHPWRLDQHGVFRRIARKSQLAEPLNG